MSTDILALYLTIFTGFFATMNPFANTSIFISLVEGKDQVTKKRIARISSLTAYLIVILFTILGKYIFKLFDLTIPSFKVCGGILLFFVGLDILRDRGINLNTGSSEDDNHDSIAISPLAIPVLAGPGVIITAMNNVTEDMGHTSVVIAIFTFNLLLSYLSFLYSDILVKKIGQNLIVVMGKIMGFILSVMGTGMVIEGIKLAFDL